MKKNNYEPDFTAVMSSMGPVETLIILFTLFLFCLPFMIAIDAAYTYLFPPPPPPPPTLKEVVIQKGVDKTIDFLLKK